MEHLLLKESLTKPESWNAKIPKSILCYNFHHGSANSYHVGNTKERKLNSTKDGGRREEYDIYSKFHANHCISSEFNRKIQTCEHEGTTCPYFLVK